MRRIYQTGLVGIAVGLCGMLAIGCGSHTTIVQQDAQGPSAAAVSLYQANCSLCHGDNLEGGIGPNLQHVGSKLSESAIVHQIDVGGGPMPGYGPNHQHILTTSEIQELATWLGTKQ